LIKTALHAFVLWRLVMELCGAARANHESEQDRDEEENMTGERYGGRKFLRYCECSLCLIHCHQIFIF
jgi:hypothetical protein